MHSRVLVLAAIHYLKNRRPDGSVLVGDLQDTLYRSGVIWKRGTVQGYLRAMVDEAILERLDLNVYRLILIDET
ncbi:hypothetical protein ACFFLM_05025 [Deinococcus oregonensis]|uniref:Uncharacterized protein n=1 Tax=Deinococcus oregonensis TaxID=1805970 RepID=A0ABV6AXC4_9DEIO